MATASSNRTLESEQLTKAMAAFAAVMKLGFNAVLDGSGQEGYDEVALIVRDHQYRGVVHEDIGRLMLLAERWGGRLFLHKGEFCIVWPTTRTPGPGDPSPEEKAQQRGRGRRTAVA